MRKFSLVFATTVMAVGLAVSGSASAEDIPSNYEVLTEGKILMESGSGDQHFFTVHYDGEIYGCRSFFGGLLCMKPSMQSDPVMKFPV
jgi:hypothetical protein